MWHALFGNEFRRKYILRNLKAGPLHDYYSRAMVQPRSKFINLDYAVLDFETTGLKVKTDHIVSIGYVEIKQMGIKLDSAWHQLIKSQGNLPEETTVIHQITDDMLVEGMKLEDAMRLLLTRLAGKVLVAHHAQIEVQFLNKISQDLYGRPFLIPVVDTQVLAKRFLQLQGVGIKNSTLRLFNLCEHFGLPAYKAHHALNDALATAELFLVLLSSLYPKHDGKLRDLLN